MVDKGPPEWLFSFSSFHASNNPFLLCSCDFGNTEKTASLPMWSLGFTINVNKLLSGMM